jgi:sugar (glycoside-pentoside-hexuronide) transporter
MASASLAPAAAGPSEVTTGLAASARVERRARLSRHGGGILSRNPRPAARQPLEPSLTLGTKLGFALGDHTVNISLAAVSLYYLFFLTEVAGLRPSLAALVVLAGRAVDAFTDPAMGRISDLTRSRLGRRRPYFLAGALPFGLSFALLWQDLGAGSETARFLLYAGAYVLHTLSSTVVAVPYMALLPELARDYVERTEMNVFRYAAAVIGVLLAAGGLRPLAEAFGGGSAGYGWAGALLGAWLVIPWIVVYRVTWERPDYTRPTEMSFLDGLKLAARHQSYRRLVALFLFARIPVDLVGAMLIFYFQYWLGRPDDFAPTMTVLFVFVFASLPFWMRVSRRADKRTVFILGVGWWAFVQLGFLLLGPDSPRWMVFALVAAAGLGYGIADLMPWSMLGDVIDEDDLESGERREGVYSGLFTFLRKLGGATGVAIGGFALELSGFVRGEAQSAAALSAIRVLTAIVPAAFLLLAAAVARTYPLDRARHADILRRLDARRAGP